MKILKNSLKLLFITSILFLLCSNVVLASELSNIDITSEEAVNTETTNAKIKSMMQTQEEAVEAYNVLLDSFDTGNFNYVYPDEYAGAYVEGSTLYILFTTDESNYLSHYKSLLGQYNCIEYLLVEHSQNELNQAMETAANYLSGSYQVGALYIDVMNNNAVIEVVDSNVSKANNSLLEAASTPDISSDIMDMIQIKPGSYSEPVKSYNLVAGNQIKVGNYYYTLGVCGTFNGNKVAVTAGHGVTSGSYVRYLTNVVQFGVVSKVQFANNQVGDFSYFSTNYPSADTYVTTPLVRYSTGATTPFKGTVSSLPVGTYIYKFGKTTGESYLRVTAVNVSVPIEQKDGTIINIRLMTRAVHIKGTTHAGDSGGPIRYNLSFAGITSSVSKDGTTMHFTPYSILQQNGFKAYVNY